MLLGSEQVYVTIKLFKSYNSVFLSCISFHFPIETLLNMLSVETKTVVTKTYDIYMYSGFYKYWLKTTFFSQKTISLPFSHLNQLT